MSDPLLLSTPLANAMLVTGSMRAQLALGFLYIFSGPVPATADAALDMAASHTELVKISVSGTGLTFESAASLGAMVKTIAETWAGTNAFSGVNSAASTQLATFFRFVSAADGDAGRTVVTTQKRLQGTVGASGTHMELTNPTLTNGNAQGINAFEIRLPRG